MSQSDCRDRLRVGYVWGKLENGGLLYTIVDTRACAQLFWRAWWVVIRNTTVVPSCFPNLGAGPLFLESRLSLQVKSYTRPPRPACIPLPRLRCCFVRSRSPTPVATSGAAALMQRVGYEVARNAVSALACKALRNKVVAEAALQLQPLPRLAAVLGLIDFPQIREPRHRLHVPLRMTLEVHELLSASFAALGGGACAARAGLSMQSELVELSVMISLPGAKAQPPHTDISPLARRPMCTLWCALQDVDAAMGPLTVFPADPTETAARRDWVAHAAAAERRRALQEFGSTFSPDGERCVLHGAHDVDGPAQEGLRDGDLAAALHLGEPLAFEMSTGDALLLDCRTFHFGGANESTAWRAQLSATFREPVRALVEAAPEGIPEDAGTSGDEGFTYALRPELMGRYTLGDFLLPTQRPHGGDASGARGNFLLPTQKTHDGDGSGAGGGPGSGGSYGSGGMGSGAWESELALPASLVAMLCCATTLGPAAEIAERESPLDAAAHRTVAAAHLHKSPPPPLPITAHHYDTLIRDGYLVLDGVLNDGLLLTAARDASACAFEQSPQHSASVRTDLIVWIREAAEHGAADLGDKQGQSAGGKVAAKGRPQASCSNGADEGDAFAHRTPCGGLLLAAGAGDAFAQHQPGHGLLSAVRLLRAVPFALEALHRDRPQCAIHDAASHADATTYSHDAQNTSTRGTTCKFATELLGVPRSMQLAVYPPQARDDDDEVIRGGGARYRAHRDANVVPWYSFLERAASAGVNCRELTAILYLSDPVAWSEPVASSVSGTNSAPGSASRAPGHHHGGELVLYLGADESDETGETATRVVSIPPVGGRLVVFDARSILHEVLPHHCESPRVALTLWVGGRHSSFEWLRKWGLTERERT